MGTRLEFVYECDEMIEVGKPPIIEYDCDVHGCNICCGERPWTSDKGGCWIHLQSKSAGNDDIDYVSGISYARYECPICGKYFKVELPQ